MSIAFICGVTITWLILYMHFGKKLLLEQQNKQGPEAENKQLKLQINNLQNDLNTLRNHFTEAQMHIAAVDNENTHLIKSNQKKEEEIQNLHERLTKEFEDIANRVLVTRSKAINEENSQKLADILSPFKEQIALFEKKVEDTYDKEVRDKLSLQSEVKRLFDLNHRISEETGNLTRALKGDVKKLGNWGEVILERVLEHSGLTKGREYRREVVDTNSNGETIRPDVIIDLPQNRHLIIDSKLSLYAYEEYVNAENTTQKESALKRHKERLREHIKTLFEKNYMSAQKLNCPDFVLMFIPVEASFAVAVENDNELFAFAWDKKIVPVSPSTLLATLKTIGSIWRQENQTKNAQEIARQGGALYDKLVGFVNELEKVGSNINQLQNNYSSAMLKLQTGKGNLISRAEKIRELGAKNNKTIPDHYLES
jgi:DNA recombination protein RmuC